MFLFGESGEVNNAAMASAALSRGQRRVESGRGAARGVERGRNPVAQMVIIGHQVGGAMFGKEGRFEPSNLSADEPPCRSIVPRTRNCPGAAG